MEEAPIARLDSTRKASAGSDGGGSALSRCANWPAGHKETKGIWPTRASTVNSEAAAVFGEKRSSETRGGRSSKELVVSSTV